MNSQENGALDVADFLQSLQPVNDLAGAVRLAPIILRGDSDLPAELPRKIERVGKAGRRRDFSDVHVGADQELHRPVDP